jgi:16S rRNA (cytidine1402-2'-O)-methyltransferase
MPAISDPGYLLVKEAIDKGIKVEVLPGASALLTALIGSGLSTDGFIFCGFLKRKAGKMKKELLEAASLNKTIIFYESPHRILKTLQLCLLLFGNNAKICIAREMTKKFEEFIRGDIVFVLEQMQAKKEILGELVVIIEAKSNIGK